MWVLGSMHARTHLTANYPRLVSSVVENLYITLLHFLSHSEGEQGSPLTADQNKGDPSAEQPATGRFMAQTWTGDLKT